MAEIMEDEPDQSATFDPLAWLQVEATKNGDGEAWMYAAAAMRIERLTAELDELVRFFRFEYQGRVPAAIDAALRSAETALGPKGATVVANKASAPRRRRAGRWLGDSLAIAAGILIGVAIVLGGSFVARHFHW